MAEDVEEIDADGKALRSKGRGRGRRAKVIKLEE